MQPVSGKHLKTSISEVLESVLGVLAQELTSVSPWCINKSQSDSLDSVPGLYAAIKDSLHNWMDFPSVGKSRE